MEVDMNSEPLLTTAAAAKFLSVSQAFLERDRWAGATIPYIKVGSRAVRYRMTDLQAFIDARVRRTSADASSAGDVRITARPATS